MATLTINTTAGEDARLAPAFGALLGLAGNANAAQIKANVVAYITNVVHVYENQQATATVVAGVTTIAPT
jgi:hypothetical protein